jgi:hypothetical protein
LYATQLGAGAKLDEANGTLEFDDIEIQNSSVNQALNEANQKESQRQLHSLITKIESQNLNLVTILDQVSNTTKEITLSQKYAGKQIKKESLSDPSAQLGIDDEDSEMQNDYNFDERATN